MQDKDRAEHERISLKETLIVAITKLSGSLAGLAPTIDYSDDKSSESIVDKFHSLVDEIFSQVLMSYSFLFFFYSES